jgi:hypothetical protein
LASLRMDPHDVIVFDDRKHVNATALCWSKGKRDQSSREKKIEIEAARISWR